MEKEKRQDKLIIRFKGGLGNQMFQYAMYCKQMQLGKTVCADISFYKREEIMPFVLCDVFPEISLNFVKLEDTEYYLNKQEQKNTLEKVIAALCWEKRDYTSEKEDGCFEKRIFQLKSGFVDGYWQSEKYFADIRDILLKDFCFKITDESLKQYAEDISDNAVSVHVRRGDYLKFPELFGGICDIDYYKRAMDYFISKDSQVVFYVFSDDKEWSKQAFSNYPIQVVEEKYFSDYYDWYDMYLMSKCHHNIIANSSFSWWGAWLNRTPGKEVIAPRVWMNDKKTKDIWCAEWKKM